MAANLLDELIQDYPRVKFTPGTRFTWDSHDKAVVYVGEDTTREGDWALLHELGHALLAHKDFETDMQLLQMEVAACAEAKTISQKYNITIDEDYIEDSLDTYRDWQHFRSTCPTCAVRSLQVDRHTYRCQNCSTIWHVTKSRLCRSYRRKK